MAHLKTYYCTAQDISDAVKSLSTDLTDAKKEAKIQVAEGIIDAVMQTTFRTVSDSGTATGGSTTTLEDTSKSWTTDEYANYSCLIWDGTGAGQIAAIVSNTSDTLTFRDAITAPDNTSKYEIFPFDMKKMSLIREACIALAALMCIAYNVAEFTTNAQAALTGDMLWAEADRALGMLADKRILDYLSG